jgi:hypothetical protein
MILQSNSVRGMLILRVLLTLKTFIGAPFPLLWKTFATTSACPTLTIYRRREHATRYSTPMISASCFAVTFAMMVSMQRWWREDLSCLPSPPLYDFQLKTADFGIKVFDGYWKKPLLFRARVREAMPPSGLR